MAENAVLKLTGMVYSRLSVQLGLKEYKLVVFSVIFERVEY